MSVSVIAGLASPGQAQRAPEAAREVAIAARQAEQVVFRRAGGIEGGRRYLETQLKTLLADIDGACNLSDQQKMRIELMGRGDIKRFFASFERVQQRFLAEFQKPQAMGEVLPDLLGMRRALDDTIFGETSLLGKSLGNVLSPEQQTKYDEVLQLRRGARHRAAVDLAVAAIEQGVPLTAKQRTRLRQLFMRQTQEPAGPGYDVRVMFWQLSQLPREALRQEFDDVQWQVLSGLIAQAEALEEQLQLAGVLPPKKDEVADAR